MTKEDVSGSEERSGQAVHMEVRRFRFTSSGEAKFPAPWWWLWAGLGLAVALRQVIVTRRTARIFDHLDRNENGPEQASGSSRRGLLGKVRRAWRKAEPVHYNDRDGQNYTGDTFGALVSAADIYITPYLQRDVASARASRSFRLNYVVSGGQYKDVQWLLKTLVPMVRSAGGAWRLGIIVINEDLSSLRQARRLVRKYQLKLLLTSSRIEFCPLDMNFFNVPAVGRWGALLEKHQVVIHGVMHNIGIYARDSFKHAGEYRKYFSALSRVMPDTGWLQLEACALCPGEEGVADEGQGLFHAAITGSGLYDAAVHDSPVRIFTVMPPSALLAHHPEEKMAFVDGLPLEKLILSEGMLKRLSHHAFSGVIKQGLLRVAEQPSAGRHLGWKHAHVRTEDVLPGSRFYVYKLKKILTLIYILLADGRILVAGLIENEDFYSPGISQHIDGVIKEFLRHEQRQVPVELAAPSKCDCVLKMADDILGAREFGGRYAGVVRNERIFFRIRDKRGIPEILELLPGYDPRRQVGFGEVRQAPPLYDILVDGRMIGRVGREDGHVIFSPNKLGDAVHVVFMARHILQTAPEGGVSGGNAIAVLLALLGFGGVLAAALAYGDAAAQLALMLPVLGPVLSSNELLRRAVAGDDRALEAFYKRFYDRTRRDCIRYGIPVREAEDTVQEIFSKVIAARGRKEAFDPARDGVNWFHLIVGRICMNYLRKRHEEIFADASRWQEIEERAEDEAADVADDLQDRREQVYAAMKRLNDLEWETLNLHFFEGLSHRKIGARFGKTEGACRVILSRAVRHLQDAVRPVRGQVRAGKRVQPSYLIGFAEESGRKDLLLRAALAPWTIIHELGNLVQALVTNRWRDITRIDLLAGITYRNQAPPCVGGTLANLLAALLLVPSGAPVALAFGVVHILFAVYELLYVIADLALDLTMDLSFSFPAQDPAKVAATADFNFEHAPAYEGVYNVTFPSCRDLAALYGFIDANIPSEQCRVNIRWILKELLDNVEQLADPLHYMLDAQPVDCTLMWRRRDFGGRRGIEIMLADNGPGFDDIEKAVTTFYTGKPLCGQRGEGLPGSAQRILEHRGAMVFSSRGKKFMVGDRDLCAGVTAHPQLTVIQIFVAEAVQKLSAPLRRRASFWDEASVPDEATDRARHAVLSAYAGMKAENVEARLFGGISLSDDQRAEIARFGKILTPSAWMAVNEPFDNIDNIPHLLQVLRYDGDFPGVCYESTWTIVNMLRKHGFKGEFLTRRDQAGQENYAVTELAGRRFILSLTQGCYLRERRTDLGLVMMPVEYAAAHSDVLPWLTQHDLIFRYAFGTDGVITEYWLNYPEAGIASSRHGLRIRSVERKDIPLEICFVHENGTVEKFAGGAEVHPITAVSQIEAARLYPWASQAFLKMSEMLRYLARSAGYSECDAADAALAMHRADGTWVWAAGFNEQKVRACLAAQYTIDEIRWFLEQVAVHEEQFTESAALAAQAARFLDRRQTFFLVQPVRALTLTRWRPRGSAVLWWPVFFRPAVRGEADGRRYFADAAGSSGIAAGGRVLSIAASRGRGGDNISGMDESAQGRGERWNGREFSSFIAGDQVAAAHQGSSASAVRLRRQSYQEYFLIDLDRSGYPVFGAYAGTGWFLGTFPRKPLIGDAVWLPGLPGLPGKWIAMRASLPVIRARWRLFFTDHEWVVYKVSWMAEELRQRFQGELTTKIWRSPSREAVV